MTRHAALIDARLTVQMWRRPPFLPGDRASADGGCGLRSGRDPRRLGANVNNPPKRRAAYPASAGEISLSGIERFLQLVGFCKPHLGATLDVRPDAASARVRWPPKEANFA